MRRREPRDDLPAFRPRSELRRIRQLCHTSTDGTSLKAICHAATELGLAARALKVSLRNLSSMPLPAIVHWESNHWIVLYDVADTYVKVADPALGLRKIPRAEFERSWSGYAALFDYTAAFENAPKATGARLDIAFPLKVRTISFRSSCSRSLLPSPAPLPDLHRDGGRQSDCGKRRQPAQGRPARDGRGAVLRPGIVARAGILLSFAAVRLDAAILDFLTRQIFVAADELFPSRRTATSSAGSMVRGQVREFAIHHGIGALSRSCDWSAHWLDDRSTARRSRSPSSPPRHSMAGMYFSRKVLRPLYAEVEEGQGKYSSHRIDAIKGVEAVEAAAAENVFRDMMLNESRRLAREFPEQV